MRFETSPRFLLTRLLGLVLFLSLYGVFFASADGKKSGEAPPDATEAVQSWLTGRPTEAGYGEGVATLRITRPIEIRLSDVGPFAWEGVGGADGRRKVRIVMAGPGPAIRLIGTHAGTADPASVKPEVWEREATPILDGVEIIGDHPEACGIELAGTMQPVLTRVTIRRCLHGIHLVNRNRNVTLAQCNIYENRGAGVFLDNVDLHQINVTGCHISYNGGGGVVSRGGNVRNLHITGCDIESNMSRDTPPTANVLIDCRESTYGTAEVAITGCTIQHNSSGPDSANIRILGRSLPSRMQEVVREGNITITGNVLSDVQCNVHLNECRGVTLNGNTFWMGYEHNLLVENCTNVSVGPNNLDRNPRYAYGTALETVNAVEFRDCSDCTIDGLHITNVWKAKAGLLFERCQWMNISDCTVLDCDGPGVMLKDCRDCRLSGLMIRDARQAPQEAVSVQMQNCTEIRLIDDGLFAGRVER